MARAGVFVEGGGLEVHVARQRVGEVRYDLLLANTAN